MRNLLPQKLVNPFLILDQPGAQGYILILQLLCLFERKIYCARLLSKTSFLSGIKLEFTDAVNSN